LPEELALPAALEAGHSGAFVANAEGLLFCFFPAIAGGEELGVVQLGFGERGGAEDLLEEALGAIKVSGLPVGIGQKPGGTLEVVTGIGGDDAFEIGAGGSEIA